MYAPVLYKELLCLYMCLHINVSFMFAKHIVKSKSLYIGIDTIIKLPKFETFLRQTDESLGNYLPNLVI